MQQALFEIEIRKWKYEYERKFRGNNKNCETVIIYILLIIDFIKLEFSWF